jgi:hypothetical protein
MPEYHLIFIPKEPTQSGPKPSDSPPPKQAADYALQIAEEWEAKQKAQQEPE